MMPFGMSMGGSNLFQHHLGNGAVQRSSQQQRARNLRKLTAAAAAATAGAAGVHLYRNGQLASLLPQKSAAKGAKPLLQIPRELADVICGAFGEIVQVAILYPLDTIKVRPNPLFLFSVLWWSLCLCSDYCSSSGLCPVSCAIN